MIKNTYSKGSAHVVVTVILVIALLGAVGFIFWQNFIKTELVSQTKVEVQDKTSDVKKDEVQDENEGYVVLREWNVRFKLPQGSEEIVYYPAQTQVGAHYEFTTKRVENLGEGCVEPGVNGIVTRLGYLSRSQTKNQELHGSVAANNNEPIDGYYYYVSAAQSTCAEQSLEIQSADRTLVTEILKAPLSVK